MAVALDVPSNMAGTSLYAAIKLVRLVHNIKDYLKSRIKKCVVSAKPPKTPRSSKLDTYACKTVSR